MLLSIEGNIGSGKSKLLELLKHLYKDNENVIFIDEPVSEWETVKANDQNIIELFYQNKERYSFPFQILAYITRLRKLLDALENNPDKTIICERSIYTDKYVFAKMLYQQDYINEIEWQSYNYWFDTFKDKTKLDTIIYIQTDPSKCYDRIKKRNRSGESDIPLDYLEHCHNLHQKWLENNETENIINFNGNIELTENNTEDYIKELKNYLEV